MSDALPYPVAIGGIGGSGTRVAAALLQMLGYYLGDDLNDTLDNLWFTLLFKRRSVLLDSDAAFGELFALFTARMSGGAGALTDGQRAAIFRLAERERLQVPRDWLLAWADSFANGPCSKRPDQPWGWKEPNTHVVLPRIFRLHPQLRYIHVLRHPLDMAVGHNQNQLQNWGPVLLDRDVVIDPRTSLSYWCAAHRMIVEFARSWPERTMLIDFEALCAAPDRLCGEIAGFLGATLAEDVPARLSDLVRPPNSTGRFRAAAPEEFDPEDLAYVAAIGYETWHGNAAESGDRAGKCTAAVPRAEMATASAAPPAALDEPDFFEVFPRFLETTETIPSANRLNARYRAIIAWNRPFFEGQRVLDLGSHDGRWSFAALHAGARHVTAIEARAHLVEKAGDNFSAYGIEGDAYHLIQGAVAPALRSLPDGSIDLMMCLGFFYHTMDHMAILLEARRLGVEHIVLDTSIAPDEDALIRLGFEPIADPRMSIDYGETGRADALVGMPSRAAVVAMLDYAGYEADFFDWHDGGVDGWSDLSDYQQRVRVTVRGRRR